MPSPAMRWSKCRDSCAVHTRLRAWQRHSDVPTRGMGLSNATGSLSCTRSPPHHCQSTALTRETPRNASAPHCRLSLACVRPLDGVGLRHFCLAHRADAGPRPFADAPHTVPGYAPPSRHLIRLRRAIKRWRFQPRCSAARTALHSTDLLSGAALDPGGKGRLAAPVRTDVIAALDPALSFQAVYLLAAPAFQPHRLATCWTDGLSDFRCVAALIDQNLQPSAHQCLLRLAGLSFDLG